MVVIVSNDLSEIKISKLFDFTDNDDDLTWTETE